MSNWEKYLEEIYFDPSHPGSFQNPQSLYKVIKKEKKFKITLKEIKNWLSTKNTYTLNKFVKRTFERNRVIVGGIDDQWDADLASFYSYRDTNDNFSYLLCVIDIFSRFAWIEPLKNKTANEIKKAFQKILSEGRKPLRLRTDAATDFTSKIFQNLVKSKGFIHFTTHNEKQANYVERFIKTIKNKIYRYMTSKNTTRYIDVLSDIVNSYNNTWHSGIQSEPKNVNKQNEKQLWYQMYWPKKYNSNAKNKIIHYSLDIGDKVRMLHAKEALDREYGKNWTTEIFIVKKRFTRQGLPIYKLKDWLGENVKGTFYEQELQKTEGSDEDFFKVDKILKYKGRGQNKKALVSFLDWPKKFNQWISVKNIIDI